jgi:hypothetical protein
VVLGSIQQHIAPRQENRPLTVDSMMTEQYEPTGQVFYTGHTTIQTQNISVTARTVSVEKM